jgi:hypothetical protein
VLNGERAVIGSSRQWPIVDTHRRLGDRRLSVLRDDFSFDRNARGQRLIDLRSGAKGSREVVDDSVIGMEDDDATGPLRRIGNVVVAIGIGDGQRLCCAGEPRDGRVGDRLPVGDDGSALNWRGRERDRAGLIVCQEADRIGREAVRFDAEVDDGLILRRIE